MIITWIALIMFVAFLAVDSTCFYILVRVVFDYRNKHRGKYQIPGYNIYIYLKWKKEFKE